MNANFDLKGVAQLVGHINSVQASANKFDLAVVTSMAAEAKKVIVATGQPHHLSRWNDGRGLNLNASYKITATPVPTAIVTGTPPGVWRVLESGAKPHLIGNRSAGRGRRGKRNQSGGFLGRPGVFAATAPVQHPGMPAEHAWEKSASAAIAVNRATIGTVRRTEYVKFFAGI